MDLDLLEWILPNCTGDIPIGRSRHTANMFGNEMLIHGGDLENGGEDRYKLEFSNETFLYNIGIF